MDYSTILTEGIKAIQSIPVKLDFNSTAQKTLNETKSIPITELRVYRTPLQTYVDIGLTALTAGDWDKAVRKYGIDEIFHLYMIAKLKNGKSYIIEKNEVPHIEQATADQIKILPPNYMRVIPLPKYALTIPKLVMNALAFEGRKKFFTYNFRTNNCQVFVGDILRANNLLTPDLDAYIHQPIDKIASEIADDKLFLPSALPNIAGIFSSRM